MTHECAADGCKKEISIALLMCRPHWKKVPRPIQRSIWRTVHIAGSDYYSHVTDAILAVAQAESGGQMELV